MNLLAINIKCRRSWSSGREANIHFSAGYQGEDWEKTKMEIVYSQYVGELKISGLFKCIPMAKVVLKNIGYAYF